MQIRIAKEQPTAATIEVYSGNDPYGKGREVLWRRITYALSRAPHHPGNLTNLGAALIIGLLCLTLGLFGLFYRPTHLTYLAFTALGLGAIFTGTAEFLPPRLRRLTVVLRITGLLLGLAFPVLALTSVASGVDT